MALRCPMCRGWQFETRRLEAGPEAEQCAGCQGVWISSQRYFGFLEERSGQQVDGAVTQAPAPADSPVMKMCPSCGKFMRWYDIGHGVSFGVEYDIRLRTLWREITLPARDQRTTDLLPEAIDREAFARMLKRNPDRLSEYKLQIALLGIGPILLAGAPGELVAELGAMIKWSSPFLKTYPLFQATDSAGYIPTANQFLWGGYEPVTSHFAQGAGEKLVQETIAAAYELIKKTPLTMPARDKEVIGYAGR